MLSWFADRWDRSDQYSAASAAVAALHVGALRFVWLAAYRHGPAHRCAHVMLRCSARLPCRSAGLSASSVRCTLINACACGGGCRFSTSTRTRQPIGGARRRSRRPLVYCGMHWDDVAAGGGPGLVSLPEQASDSHAGLGGSTQGSAGGRAGADQEPHESNNSREHCKARAARARSPKSYQRVVQNHYYLLTQGLPAIEIESKIR